MSTPEMRRVVFKARPRLRDWQMGRRDPILTKYLADCERYIVNKKTKSIPIPVR